MKVFEEGNPSIFFGYFYVLLIFIAVFIAILQLQGALLIICLIIYLIFVLCSFFFYIYGVNGE
ncbi:MAG: hypothetical protein DRN24_06325 [Thermoplasmata archaeon]|nr:MAG: hypothetical protein DRN24_06325 [Thermoplasmata archaeon]